MDLPDFSGLCLCVLFLGGAGLELSFESESSDSESESDTSFLDSLACVTFLFLTESPVPVAGTINGGKGEGIICIFFWDRLDTIDGSDWTT